MEDGTSTNLMKAINGAAETGLIDAHCFWHGSELSLYEKACLQSFVRQGARVNLHTFDPGLSVPDGVIRRDAACFANPHEVHAYTQNGVVGSIAAFSDVLRYRILAQRPGWWIDTDVFCLQSTETLRQLELGSPGLILGVESARHLNGAVMCITDAVIAQTLSAMAEAKGKVFGWGDIGPKLLTTWVEDNRARIRLMDQATFYPFAMHEIDEVFDPAQTEHCAAVCASSLTIHLWNQYLQELSLPKSVLPPEGSYLANLFATLPMRVEAQASLSIDTFARLQQVGRLTRFDRRLLGFAKFLRGLRKRRW